MTGKQILARTVLAAFYTACTGFIVISSTVSAIHGNWKPMICVGIIVGVIALLVGLGWAVNNL